MHHGSSVLLGPAAEISLRQRAIPGSNSEQFRFGEGADFLGWSDQEGYVSTLSDFTEELYSALGSDQIVSSVEAAWGPGVFAASLKEKTAGEWRVAPLPQWSKDQPFRSGNWGGSCNSVTKQSKYPKAATLFSIWLNTQKAPVIGNWVNTGIFPASLSGLTSPDLNDPEKNPSKFCGGQNIAQLYSDAAKAINVDFAWAPWFAYANDNYNKHIAELLSGSATVKQPLDGWLNTCLKNPKTPRTASRAPHAAPTRPNPPNL